MKFRLGRRGDYAVRAVFDLARHPGERRKTRQIAGAMDIPRKYLPQILADLVRAGMLDAHAGPAGGYSLAVPAAQITLLEVVEAAEEPLTLVTCVLRGGPCDEAGPCAVHDTWKEAQAAFADRLARTNFADLGTFEKTRPR